MIDELRELASELREHWNDGYWWADRQLLLAVLVALLTGGIAFLSKWGELALTDYYARKGGDLGA